MLFIHDCFLILNLGMMHSVHQSDPRIEFFDFNIGCMSSVRERERERQRVLELDCEQFGYLTEQLEARCLGSENHQ